MRDLTEKQKVFVSEYLKDFNGSRAYKVAYPDCKTDATARVNASKLLTNTNISEAIREKADKQLEKVDVDVSYIIKNIVEITERCMQHEPVTEYDPVNKEYVQVTAELFDENGNPAGETGVYQFNARDGLKGLELLGKYKNIFKENVDVNVKTSNKLKDVFSQLGGEGLSE